MIYQFINYINHLAQKENGKLIKIFGNHEFMNYGPTRDDWEDYLNNGSKGIDIYCKKSQRASQNEAYQLWRNIGGEGNWMNDEWAYATEYCRY